MGVMKEKLEAVMNEWNKEEEAQVDKKVPLSKRITDYLLKHPNSTALQVTDYIMREYPKTLRANVSSILKQLSDRNHLERDYYFDPIIRRSSYKYRVVSGERRQELETIRRGEEKAAEERLEKMRIQAEAARMAKAAKREERLKAQEHEGTGISAALPTSTSTPAPAPKRNSAQEILDSLSITQAREVYDELKKIFGG